MASATIREKPFSPRRAASSRSRARCSALISMVVLMKKIYMHVHVIATSDPRSEETPGGLIRAKPPAWRADGPETLVELSPLRYFAAASSKQAISSAFLR